MEWEVVQKMGLPALILLVGTFLLSTLLLHFIIPVLRAKKIGQSIREEGPSWHQSKAGTPTMGGIGFIMAILVMLLIFSIIWVVRNRDRATDLIPMALALCLGVAHAMIGFVDDYCKLIKKQNEGLTAMQKLFLQFFVTGAYLAMMGCTVGLETDLVIPFTGGFSLPLGWFAYVLYLLVIVGFVNSTNLTDGLDGLAASVCSVVSVFMVLTAFRGEGSPMLSALSCTLLGGMLGFLVYNHHPAKVFMGDTGSLFLGGLIMGCAIMQGQLLVFVLAGFVFVIEMLSTLLQVVFFKLTHGKRIFKMAPLHHHFEKCGWTEWPIVGLFAGVSVLFCVVAWLGS